MVFSMVFSKGGKDIFYKNLDYLDKKNKNKQNN